MLFFCKLNILIFGLGGPLEVMLLGESIILFLNFYDCMFCNFYSFHIITIKIVISKHYVKQYECVQRMGLGFRNIFYMTKHYSKLKMTKYIFCCSNVLRSTTRIQQI